MYNKSLYNSYTTLILVEMALLTAIEFSDLCLVKRTSLAAYEARGKIIASGEGRDKKYDTDNELNKAFYQKMSSKGMSTGEEQEIIRRIARTPAPNRKSTSKVQESLDAEICTVESEVDEDGIPAYHTSEKKLKWLDTLKRDSEIELNKLKIQKQRGEVVPTILIHPVFLQHNQYIINEFKNAIDETIRLFTKMKDLEPEESAQLKGIMTERVNDAMRTAAGNTAASVKSIISDYTSKRAVGERI